MIKKIICFLFLVFFSSTVMASIGDISDCKTGSFKIKPFAASQNSVSFALVQTTGWFSRNIVQTIVPEEDIDSCALDNKNIIVGGASGLTKVDDNKLLPAKSSKPDHAIFNCFCKLNRNLLDGCKYNEGDTYMECSKTSGSWTRDVWK